MKKKIIILIMAAGMVLSACSGKEKKEYGNASAIGSGTISTSDDSFEINLKNIFAGKGMDIDYLGDVKIEDGCDVTVDSSAVNIYEPGDYSIIYTVTKGNRTESETVTLTVRDNGESVTDAKPEDFKSGEVITDSDVTYPVQDAQTAKIELMSGKVAHIKCTTERYIVRTRTDSYNIVKNKEKYNVKKLIVVFNTGEEQVLETIQKKID